MNDSFSVVLTFQDIINASSTKLMSSGYLSTINKNLRSYNNEIDLFNIKNPSYPILDDNLHILEVKFSNYLPQLVKYLLNSIDAIPHSISKYTLCQKHINPRPWTDSLSVPF